MDRFKQVVETQKEFEKQVGYDFDSMSKKDKCAFAKNMGYFIIEETTEMLRELPYHKDWKDYSKLSGAEKNEMFKAAQNEWHDVFTFVLAVGLALDLTADDMLKGFEEKNVINCKRQTEGY